MRYKIIMLIGALITCLTLTTASNCRAQQEISVQAAVDRQQVYVGEDFQLQIRVDGNDDPIQPNLSLLTDFRVEPLGGQQNSSESFTMINGKVSRISKRGYVYSYRLSPSRAGKLLIPALEVEVEGKIYTTSPITINARTPEESTEFILRQELASTTLYVGQPVELTVSWYINRDVNGFTFSLPVLTDPRFVVADFPESPSGAAPKDVVTIAIDQNEITASKENGSLNGEQYLIIRFRKILIPREPGEITLEKATVTSKVLSHYQPRQNSFPFGSRFDAIGRQGVYQTILTSSNQPRLTIMPLPTVNRPAGFSGLVGTFNLTATAEPTTVNVGDPITLTVTVTGEQYLANVELPDLATLPGLSGDFKIPGEMAPGRIQDTGKVFIQTVRANSPTVQAIPPIPLSFFNPANGRYETSRSAPIPITVKATRVVTAGDAEGAGPVTSRSEVTAVHEGIAHNYEEDSVLASDTSAKENNTDMLFWLLLALPPGLFFLLLIGRQLTLQRSDPRTVLARKALPDLRKAIHTLEQQTESSSSQAYPALSLALRTYLGRKLDLAPGVITCRDLRIRLADTTLPTAALDRLCEILDHCESHRFASGINRQTNLDEYLKNVLHLAEEMEEHLR